jgi:hypothetical protein
MKIKSLSDIQAKWTSVTPTRSTFYEAGVRDPNVSWAAPTAAAEGSWSAGVTAAASAKRFSKGVNAATDSVWRDGCATKGVQRWGAGVSGAGPKYGAGFSPYQSALASMTLPARGTRGSPANINRVAQIATTLHNIKIGAVGR